MGSYFLFFLFKYGVNLELPNEVPHNRVIVKRFSNKATTKLLAII